MDKQGTWTPRLVWQNYCMAAAIPTPATVAFNVDNALRSPEKDISGEMLRSFDAAHSAGAACILLTEAPENLGALADRPDVTIYSFKGPPHAEARAEILRHEKPWSLISDVPYDVRAARHAGVAVLGMAADPDTIKSLRAAGADDTIQDVQTFMRLLQFKSKAT